ncbi:MAG: lysoplasmalogenase [Anaerolineaceae bacterium]|nr:lysoplasmalogenase [Anaerolineaceae bacterium]
MLFLYLSILFGILHWFFVWKESRKGIVITKPLMMLFLILWEILYGKIFTLAANPESRQMIWFLIGLVFCTIGDMFLMFRERHFLKGLIAFLTGHVFYVIAFKTLFTLNAPMVPAVIFAAIVLLSGGLIYKRLYDGMLANDKSKMVLPVAFYTVVISAMLYSAIMTQYLGETKYAYLLITGAVLFYVSDVINAWAEFVGPVKRHRFKIMTTYYLAELLIAMGAVYTFLF